MPDIRPRRKSIPLVSELVSKTVDIDTHTYNDKYRLLTLDLFPPQLVETRQERTGKTPENSETIANYRVFFFFLNTHREILQ